MSVRFFGQPVHQQIGGGIADLGREVRLPPIFRLVVFGESLHRRVGVVRVHQQDGGHAVIAVGDAAGHLGDGVFIRGDIAENIHIPAGLADGGDDLDGIAHDAADDDEVAFALQSGDVGTEIGVRWFV